MEAKQNCESRVGKLFDNLSVTDEDVLQLFYPFDANHGGFWTGIWSPANSVNQYENTQGVDFSEKVNCVKHWK